MGKKIVFVSLSFFVILLCGCSKKANYSNEKVEVSSHFDNDKFCLELPIIDAKDGELTSNFFYTNLDFNEISEKYEYVEKTDDFIRYYQNNNYYVLQFVKMDDGKKLYKLCSESATLIVGDKQVIIPFARNISTFLSPNQTISESDYSYLIDYYLKLGIVEENNEIRLENFVTKDNSIKYVTISTTSGINIGV